MTHPPLILGTTPPARPERYDLLARRQQPHHSVIRADLVVGPERLDAQLTRMLHDQDSACVAAA